MSVWTHINGNIRIDCPLIVGLSDSSPKDKECKFLILAEEIKKMLGPQSYDNRNLADEQKNAHKYKVPKGSEGTIHYRVVPFIHWSDPSEYEPNGDCECLHINITFGGDLRDFEAHDIRLAEKWFENLVAELNEKYWIRQAFCDIDCQDEECRHILSRGMDDDKVYKMILPVKRWWSEKE